MPGRYPLEGKDSALWLTIKNNLRVFLFGNNFQFLVIFIDDKFSTGSNSSKDSNAF